MKHETNRQCQKRRVSDSGMFLQSDSNCGIQKGKKMINKHKKHCWYLYLKKRVSEMIWFEFFLNQQIIWNVYVNVSIK